MISVELNIRRYSELWGGITPETVKRYREELEELREGISSYNHERVLFISPELIRSLRSTIDEEIKYCLFYDEYLQRRDEPNFNQWVFRNQEDIPDLCTWKKAPGEQWVKTNGRVKAVIQFDRTGSMVKITLEYSNDSTALHFYDTPYKYEAPMVHLKNTQRIEEAVEQFKKDADRFLEEHQFPGGTRSDFNFLESLLHIEE